MQKATIESKGDSITKDDYTDLVLCVTGLKLAESMKIDEVVLLPELYEFFLHRNELTCDLFSSIRSDAYY